MIPLLDHDQIAIDYDFWDKNLLQMTQTYMEIIIKDEMFTKNKQFPIFKDYYNRTLKLLDERIEKPDKDLYGLAPSQIASILLYIISSISGMGFNQQQFRIHALPKKPIIIDYLLNTIDILDWYKQTYEYKIWKEEQEWREAHPVYNTKPKTDEEFARMISKIHRKMKSGRYAKDRILKNIK